MKQHKGYKPRNMRFPAFGKY